MSREPATRRDRLTAQVAWILPLVLSVFALAAVSRGLPFSPDVADLLPDAGEGAALQRYVRAFGGGDLTLVLVRGNDPARAREAASAAARSLEGNHAVHAVVDRITAPHDQDPTLTWAYAPSRARERLAHAVTPEGMRERLKETRTLLLGPGASSMTAQVQRDPLRLLQIPVEEGVRVAAGAHAQSSGALSSNPGQPLVAREGRARLLLVTPRGDALRGKEARAFVDAIEQSLDTVRVRMPDVRLDVTGGHSVAVGMESMLRGDLFWSGTLSVLLAGLMFAVSFRRLRALLAVMPPLALGTLWTVAAASFAFEHLSAITIAFVSVVVGVGVDTGVHVYAALLHARREGLTGHAAASAARRATARPALIAASVAAAAFATLSLSQIQALRQFGWLCACGEVLTALAILGVTPAIGAWLERKGPIPERKPRWVPWMTRGVRSHLAAPILAIGVFVPLCTLLVFGFPRFADTLVTLRPQSLEPIQTQEAVFENFGGDPGQWVVLVTDESLDRARQRADHLYDRLDASPEHIVDFDGLTRFAPSPVTQRARLAERDGLDLPNRVELLREALIQTGFSADRFELALGRFASPSERVADTLDSSTPQGALLRARFLGKDDQDHVAAIYVRPRPGHYDALERLVREADREAQITGYARLDTALQKGLRQDLPRITFAAAALVALAMLLSLRRGRHVVLALATLAFEVIWVLALARFFGLRIHAYNAFIIPVLLGVTVDEAMFLLHHARAGGRDAVGNALRREGPSVMATGLTTAAGFAALSIASFDGLVDMAKLGVMGVLVGLVAALLVVPVGLSIWPAAHDSEGET